MEVDVGSIGLDGLRMDEKNESEGRKTAKVMQLKTEEPMEGPSTKPNLEPARTTSGHRGHYHHPATGNEAS